MERRGSGVDHDMTYCVGMLVDEGLAMIADTRTNAGVDNISSYRKLHLIQQPGEDIEVDTVSQVLRSGYKSGDRVLRAAQVIVAVPA